MQFSVLTWNVRSEKSITIQYLETQVFPYLQRNGKISPYVDLIAFQETGVTETRLEDYFAELGYQTGKIRERYDGGDNYFFAAAPGWEMSAPAHMAGFSVEGLTRSETKAPAYVDVAREGKNFRLYNFHNRPRTSTRLEWMCTDLFSSLVANRAETLVAGDFNLFADELEEGFAGFGKEANNRYDAILYSSDIQWIESIPLDNDEDNGNQPLPEVADNESGSDHCALFAIFDI